MLTRNFVSRLCYVCILVALSSFAHAQAFPSRPVRLILAFGPGGATETVSLYAYRNYFRYLDFGYGSALAVQAVVLVALASWIIVRWAREPGEVA